MLALEKTITGNTTMKSVLTLELKDAVSIADAARDAAAKAGLRVTVAVCDSGGHLLCLYRMDGAPYMSAMLAPEKARASIMSGKSSRDLEQMINGGRFAALSMPVVPLEGGELVVLSGQIVGAVGVSGAKASDDAGIAKSGIQAVFS